MSHDLSKKSHAKNPHKFSMLNRKTLEESFGLDMTTETINQAAKLSQHTCRQTIQNTGGKYPVDKLMTICRLFSVGHFMFSAYESKREHQLFHKTSVQSLRTKGMSVLRKKPIFTQLSLWLLESQKIVSCFRLMTVYHLQPFSCIEAYNYIPIITVCIGISLQHTSRIRWLACKQMCSPLPWGMAGACHKHMNKAEQGGQLPRV